jgi:hypothetical protein
MDLPIETWLSGQALGAEPTSLLREAVVCFKAGAYRSALILSYLTFQTAVRERLLAAKAPTGVVQGQWDALQKLLRNEDRWDSTVFDAIQNQKTPMFLLSEDLREQVVYWKNRRNDCAHSKQNTIGSSHVESFWLFMQSNMPKFAVNGSRQALIDKIDRHFDPAFTPKGKDPTPLVAEIPGAIEKKDLEGFFRALNEDPIFGIADADFVSFIDCTLRFSDHTLHTAAIEYVAAEHSLFVKFVRAHPEHLLRFAGKPEMIHKLWYVDLFKGYPDYPLYDALLRNGLIAPAELPTAAERIVSRLRGVEPPDECVPRLTASGFFKVFESFAFVEGNADQFAWGNPNADLIRWYLERFPLSVEAVECICSRFGSEPCAHEPRDALEDLFSKSEAKRKEFLKIAKDNDFTLPKLIPALSDDKPKKKSKSTPAEE